MISHALHVDDGSIRLQDTCHLDLLLSEITSLGKAIDRGKGTHRKGTTGVSFEARIRRAKAVGLGEEVSVGPHRLSAVSGSVSRSANDGSPIQAAQKDPHPLVGAGTL